jgi:ABC-type phosphate transport system substrate-binding protein
MFFYSTTVNAVDIIVHPSVSEKNLTISQLRRIYTMRQTQWPDRHQIVVFVLPRQHTLHQQFSKERLQIFPYQLERIWNKLTYSGLGVAPIVVSTPEALIDAVIKTPGSIGYADKIADKGAVNVINIKK